MSTKSAQNAATDAYQPDLHREGRYDRMSDDVHTLTRFPGTLRSHRSSTCTAMILTIVAHGHAEGGGMAATGLEGISVQADDADDFVALAVGEQHQSGIRLREAFPPDYRRPEGNMQRAPNRLRSVKQPAHGRVILRHGMPDGALDLRFLASHGGTLRHPRPARQ